MRKNCILLLIFLLLCTFIYSCSAVDPAVCGENEETFAAQVTAEEAEDTQSHLFEVHFIDVGQADASLIICDGKAMLIDGGNRADSGLMYTYLKKHDINYLDYVVASHVHEDHMGGLAGAISYADFGTVYCNTDEHKSDVFADFKRCVEEAGKFIEVPCVGDNFELGSAQVTVVSRMETENENDASIVLKIVYGKTSFVFTGDIESDAEEAIVRSGADVSATVLKVSHHGSEKSTLYPFLVAASPEYAVISVGENEYGHPSDDTLGRLKIIEAECYRTDLHGDIICTSDGENVEFSFEKKLDTE